MVQEELVQLLLIVLDDNKDVEAEVDVSSAVADDDAIMDIGIGPLEVEESIGSVFEFSKEVDGGVLVGGGGGGGGRELTDLPLGAAADDVEEVDGNFRLDGPGLLGGT
jgi:hypothetical protein